jgi:hypothetical protein
MHSKESSTRVPTQITCKFLDSTSVALGRRRGRNYRREPHSVNLCIQTLTTRRENRGGIRCVRARIIGGDSGLSTRCHALRQNLINCLKINGFFPNDPTTAAQILSTTAGFQAYCSVTHRYLCLPTCRRYVPGARACSLPPTFTRVSAPSPTRTAP